MCEVNLPTSKDSQNYSCIPIACDIINSWEKAPCDVFLRLHSDKYVKVFNSGSKISTDKLNEYASKGVRHLFIPSSEQKVYWDSASEAVKLALLNKDYSAAGSQISRSLESILLTASGAGLSNEDTAENFVLFRTFLHGFLSSADQQALKVFVETLKNSPSLILHSIISTSIGFQIFTACQKTHYWYSLDTDVFMTASLFHDIGVQSFFDISGAEFDEKQLALNESFRIHPIIGGSYVSQNKRFDRRIIEVIEQHHELIDGSGYPGHLKGADVDILAQIIGLSEEIYHLSLTTGITSFSEVGFRFVEPLSAKFNQQLLQTVMAMDWGFLLPIAKKRVMA
jgi:hypothetical protein